MANIVPLPLPNQLQNGQVVDAPGIMANLNAVANAVNLLTGSSDPRNLPDSTNAANGAGQVAFNYQLAYAAATVGGELKLKPSIVTNIAGLRALLKTGNPTAIPLGYYTAADGGGGVPFSYNSADTTSGCLFTGSIAPGPTAPAAPTLGQTAGGTLAATTYYVKTFINTAAGSTLPSAESSLAVLANNVLTVTSPPTQTGATSWGVAVSTAAGTETIQANNIAIGTNWQEPTTGLIAGAAVPASNTAGSILTAPTVTNGNISVGHRLSDQGGLAATNTYVAGYITGTGGSGTTATVTNSGQTIASSTMVTDNGSTILVGWDGGRWYLASGVSPLSVKQIGVKNDGTDMSTALQQGVFNVGGRWRIPAGATSYKFGTALTADYSSATFPAVSFPSIRYDIQGDTDGNTFLEFSNTAGALYAINAIGSAAPPAALSEGVHSLDRLGNFSLYPTGRGKTQGGISYVRKAYFLIENVAIDYFATGMQLDSCLTGTLRNVFIRNNTNGLVFNDTTSFSRPNALLFEKVVFLSNSAFGITANIFGGGNKFVSCNFEQNGTQGVAGNGGFIANLTGDNGIACLSMDGCFFEGNRGDADLYLTNTTSASLTVILNGCVFNRTSSTNYVTNNILARNTGGGKLRIILIGCGFNSAGTYVPAAARPFINYDSSCEVIDLGCTYSENTSMTQMLSAAPTAGGSVTAAGAAINFPVGWSVVNNSAGVYTISKVGGITSGANGYVAMAVCNDTAGGLVVQRITQAGGSFQVVTTTAAGTLTNAAFSWTVTRLQS